MKSRGIRWVGHIKCMRDISVCRILVGKPERKSSLETRSRWDENIKMELREIRWIELNCLRIGFSGKFL
jgi:hypothetical protein